MASIVRNMAGRIGDTFVNGAFFDDGSFRSAHGIGDSRTWNIEDLPTFFRTQQDVRSTLDSLGGRSVGGRCSANVVGGKHALGWKDRPENNVTLDQLVGNKHSTLFLTQAEYVKVLAYYEIDAVKAA